MLNYVKFFFINIIVFGTLLTLVSLLFPSQIVTNKTINVWGNKSKIVTAIADTKSWSNWNLFVDSLTNLANVKAIEDAGIVNFSFENKNKQLKFSIYDAQNDSIPVNFSIAEKLKWYPWVKFGALVSDKSINRAMEISLENLKNKIETEK